MFHTDTETKKIHREVEEAADLEEMKNFCYKLQTPSTRCRSQRPRCKCVFLGSSRHSLRNMEQGVSSAVCHCWMLLKGFSSQPAEETTHTDCVLMWSPATSSGSVWELQQWEGDEVKTEGFLMKLTVLLWSVPAFTSTVVSARVLPVSEPTRQLHPLKLIFPCSRSRLPSRRSSCASRATSRWGEHAAAAC